MSRQFNVTSTKLGLKTCSRWRLKTCPCRKCQLWRNKVLNRKAYSAVQTSIRQEVHENIKLSREIDQYVRS